MEKVGYILVKEGCGLYSFLCKYVIGELIFFKCFINGLVCERNINRFRKDFFNRRLISFYLLKIIVLLFS